MIAVMKFLHSMYVMFVWTQSFARNLALKRDNLVVTRDNDTWIAGYKKCLETSNMTMATVDLFLENTTFINEAMKQGLQEPVWIFGLLAKGGTHNTKRGLLHLTLPTENARTFCLTDTGSSLTDGTMSYADAATHCQTKPPEVNESHYHLLHASETLDKLFSVTTSPIYINESFWLHGSFDVDQLLNDSVTGSKIKCLLLDDDGIKIDNCENKHKTACINGNFKSSIKYLNNSIQYYPDYDTGSETTTQPTKGTSSIQSPGTSSTVSNTTGSSFNHTQSITARPEDDNFMDSDIQYTIVGVVVFVIIVVIIAIICVVCRSSETDSSSKPELSEVYSDAADTVIFKNSAKANCSDYAVPEDALNNKKAQPRTSIGEDQYDTLSQANNSVKNKQKHQQQQQTGNIYSHVALGTNNAQKEVAQGENVYDVASHGKQSLVTVNPKDSPGDTYGNVSINTNSK